VPRPRALPRVLSCRASPRCLAGWDYAGDSWRIQRAFERHGGRPPVYHFQDVIPIAGALVLLQGLRRSCGCIVLPQDRRWPERLKDAENRRRRAAACRTALRRRGVRQSGHQNVQRSTSGAPARHGRDAKL
jgi:hypothetical protein